MFITFLKLPIFSSATRNTNKFLIDFCYQNRNKKLSLKKKWKAGRLSNGRIGFWTKSKLIIKNKISKINYNIRYNKLSFIVSFQFVPFYNKLLSLFFFSNGAITYYLSTEIHILFSYHYLNQKKKLKKFHFIVYWAPLFRLKKLIFISFIELFPEKNAQYCLSPGTKSKLWSIDKINKTSLIILPSKLKKLISNFSCVFIGKLMINENKNYFNTKSGYWRSFGLKSIVRGVAMNPVDHPHGGRTKAIRYQQTPWGKTTKYK